MVKKVVVFLQLVLCVVLLQNLACTSDERDPLELHRVEMEFQQGKKDSSSIRALLKWYFQHGYIDKLVEKYEQNKIVCGKNVMSTVYYGAALARKAGNEKTVEKKLLYVKKGVMVLDRCVKDNPDNKIPYLWRGMTYSNFPAVLDVKQISIDNFSKCLTGHKDGIWKLNRKDSLLIYGSFLSLSIIYKDRELFESAYTTVKHHFKNEKIFSRYKSVKEARTFDE